MKKKEQIPELISTDEAAELLAVTKKTINKWIRLDMLGPAFKCGYKRYIEKDRVLDMKKKNDGTYGMIDAKGVAIICDVSRSTVMKAAKMGLITKHKNILGNVVFDREEVADFFNQKRTAKRKRQKVKTDDFETGGEWMGDLKEENITMAAYERFATAVIKENLRLYRERIRLGLDCKNFERWIRSNDFEFYNFAGVDPEAIIETYRKQYGRKTS